MMWWQLLAIAFGGLLFLLLSGLPVFISFMIINVGAVLYLMGSGGLGLFVNSMMETSTSESLVAIPLFVMLGELLFRSGGVKIMFEALDRLVGAIRGRLYVVAVATSAVLGAISGSALAGAAILGRIVYPTLIERGCDRRLAIGTILGGATLEAIIPPSITGIVLATLANLSVADFLMAGVVPGLLLSGLYAGYAVFRTWLDPSLDSSGGTASTGETQPSRLAALVSIAPFCGIIFLVLGLVLFGIATPTEAAAAGIMGALLMSLATRTLSLPMLRDTCVGAVKTTSVIVIIIASSKLFSQVLAFTGATAGVIQFASDLAVSPWAFYVGLMIVVFFLAMFLDALAIMLIVVPIYAPIVTLLGFDLLWFWMMFMVNLLFGGITPPLGLTIFVFQSAQPGVPTKEIYKSIFPVLLIAFFGVVILSIFPTLTTWLPNLY